MVYSFGVIDECFPDRQKHRGSHVYTEEFIKSLVEKYPLKNDLRKNDVGAYMYFHKHGLLDKFYPKRVRPITKAKRKPTTTETRQKISSSLKSYNNSHPRNSEWCRKIANGVSEHWRSVPKNDSIENSITETVVYEAKRPKKL